MAGTDIGERRVQAGCGEGGTRGSQEWTTRGKGGCTLAFPRFTIAEARPKHIDFTPT
jgi:hypothetical protein